MATNSRPTRPAGQRPTGSNRPNGASNNMRRRKKSSKRKSIIFIFEILIILVMLGGYYIITRTTNGEGPKRADIVFDDADIGIVAKPIDPVKGQEEVAREGYLNVALFGVDARKESELYKGSRSDSIMIASINMDTGDIKLVSVYRDTFLNLGDDSYRKCNHAYAYGGAEQAIKMLNINLDMDIRNFVTVGYKGLIDVIDGLGGIYLDIDDTEIKHINNYQITIVNDVTKGSYTPITKTGYQKVDGLQAAAYCRIRYGGGDDFKRASRQREVIKAIEEQAKQTDFLKLQEVFNKAIGNVYTNIDNDTILDLIKNITKYSIVEEDGFPQENMRTTGNIGAKGSSVIPLDLSSNVVWLHQFLFEDKDYQVPSTVAEYGKKIKNETSPYLNRTAE